MVQAGQGQFQIYYKSGPDHLEYQPDFVAETKTTIYMMEPKARNEMEEGDVLAKMVAAVKWRKQATDHAATCPAKPWHYLLIPHDVISENMAITGLAGQFGVK